MLKPKRHRNYCLRDHVNHSKFCFDIIGQTIQRLNILICLVPQNRIKHLDFSKAGPVSIYNVNCEGNALNYSKKRH